MKCIDVKEGTYNCAYNIMLPYRVKFDWEDESKAETRTVAIDKCLLPEVLNLWEMGIKTTGNCCGHGQSDKSFIGVKDEFIPKMKELGYTVWKNPFRPDDEDNFIPKTILNKENANCGFNWWDVKE